MFWEGLMYDRLTIMFRLESQNWFTIMIQFDYSIAWEVASEIHCAKYGVEIANQTFTKRKTWHPTLNVLFLWQKGKNEKARSVIKFILKFKRQPGGQSKHGLMLLWFKKFCKCNQDVTIHKPNVSILLSSAFIRDDLIVATRGPFICLLSSCPFSDEVLISVR